MPHRFIEGNQNHFPKGFILKTSLRAIRRLGGNLFSMQTAFSKDNDGIVCCLVWENPAHLIRMACSLTLHAPALGHLPVPNPDFDLTQQWKRKNWFWTNKTHAGNFKNWFCDSLTHLNTVDVSFVLCIKKQCFWRNVVLCQQQSKTFSLFLLNQIFAHIQAQLGPVILRLESNFSVLKARDLSYRQGNGCPRVWQKVKMSRPPNETKNNS